LWASDVSLTARGGVYLPTDAEMQTGKNIQVDLKWKVVYLYGSYTDMTRRIAGQQSGQYRLYSVGAGLNVPISKYVNVWGQCGYYSPSADMQDAGKLTVPDGSMGEAQFLYWREWGNDYNYDVSAYSVYSYKVRGNIGGAVGTDIHYPITKHLEVGVSASYTFLKLPETYYAYLPQYSGNGGMIETIKDKNLSGFGIGLNLTYRF